MGILTIYGHLAYKLDFLILTVLTLHVNCLALMSRTLLVIERCRGDQLEQKAAWECIAVANQCTLILWFLAQKTSEKTGH